MKLAALIGSVRKDSFNRKIADFIGERYQSDFTLEKLGIQELPYFDQDQETDPPESVRTFKQKVKDADAILIVTPEYNHSVPGILKNAIDWVSRIDLVMAGKPVLMIGASPGFLGTVRCQLHLKQILAAPGVSALVLPGNEVFIGEVHKKMDDTGKITDEGTVEFLDGVMKNFKTFIESK
ncbi:NADPH-dependent FMN reductase [Alkalicoccus daliensis]|uniref:NAD(P)H-dependent FMN reductase n=1 Tax=Alkalicoccus daliensis TaxID=745820 RepID=A0A1H0F4U4_9BACI|nr:NADPH-dependent FMN reductase [Alkalicoccus daliensis]SDN89668.1 NAD(P)H-dependent FMN reductase [Alkalicoccus daliensis]